jgi:hypothetical protein
MIDHSPITGISIMFQAIPSIVILGFIFVFGTFIVYTVRSVKQWKKNNDSPVLTVEATVVAKRADVRYHHHNETNMHHTSSYTSYYVTFEVASGDRMEFKVPNTEYGMLVEKDRGKLTFQGTRYLGFERSNVSKSIA